MKYDLPYGMRFSILGRTFKRQLDQRLLEKDLTGVQLGVLKELERLEAAGAAEVNQRDLENASHVTHPTMTEILKRLEKQGFISCHPGTKDRRYKCVSTTEKATQLLEEMVEVDKQIFAKLCTGLSGEQISSLIAMTDVMIENAGCTRKGKQKI